MLLCSLTRMVLVSHGNVCRALLVSLLSWFGAVSALDSHFGSWLAISGCSFFAQRLSLSGVAGGGMDGNGSALAASFR